LAEAQKQNQQKQNASEASASEGISEREQRIAEAEKRLEETEKAEAQKPTEASVASEPQKLELEERKAEAEKPEEKPPEKVERFIELRLKGLGYREAVRASGLSGYMWDKWKGYIVKRLEEAGLKEAESEEERLRKEAKGAEKTIERIVGEIPEEEKTEEMKTLDRLAANVEYARRIIPRIAYPYGYGEGKPVEKPEAPKAEEKAAKKAEEEKPEEKPKEEKPEGYPMLIPIKEIRHPDGKVEIQYTLGPEHYRVVRQTDMAVDRVVPELINEVKETRRDISSIGNRIFTLIENYWGPQLKKIQPWTYFPIPISQRTPAERERELAMYERQIAEKASPPPKAEAQAPKAETEEKKEKA